MKQRREFWEARNVKRAFGVSEISKELRKKAKCFVFWVYIYFWKVIFFLGLKICEVIFSFLIHSSDSDTEFDSAMAHLSELQSLSLLLLSAFGSSAIALLCA